MAGCNKQQLLLHYIARVLHDVSVMIMSHNQILYKLWQANFIQSLIPQLKGLDSSYYIKSQVAVITN